MTNLCQFMLIYYRFFLIYLAQIPQTDVLTPIFYPKNQPSQRNEPKNPKKTPIFFKISPQSFGN